MKHKRTKKRTVRLLSLLALISLTLAPAALVRATPPIGTGQTIEFNAAGTDVGACANHARDVTTADLDNDGDLDVVSVDNSGAITAWQNDGTPFSGGTWTSNNVGASTTYLWAVAVGDLDNDGNLDIVVGAGNPENYEIIAWQNDGTPFTGAWTQNDVGTPSGQHGYSVALADLDNDGDLDIASTNQDGAFEIYVWQNDGTPFTGLWTGNGVYSLGGTYSSFDVALGDLDNDGYVDIVTQENVAGVGMAVYRNDGTPFSGTWTRNPAGSNSSNIGQVNVGDVDNDGDLDIVYGDNDDVSVYENDGTPFAGAWTINTVGTVAAAVYYGLSFADLDNDGDLDVVGGAGSAEDYEVITWQNDGSPFSGAWAQLDVGASIDNVNGIAVGDLDNDGDVDIVSSSESGEDFEVIAWQNDAVHRNAPYADSGQSLDSSFSTGMDLGDVDGDGDLDAWVANWGSGNKVWTNNGSGAFTDSGQSLGSTSSTRMALGDLDGDGDLDAFVTNTNIQANRVWTNNGSGTFTDSGQTLGNSNSYDVALGDLDGDGDLDAFVANYLNAANKVWTNNGSGTFTDSGQLLGSSNSRGVTLGDVDRDGDLDAFVANYGQANKVWTNDGSGTFTDSGQTLGSSQSYVAALGDVDGDGDLDAWVANYSSQANKVWMNDGSGTFTDSGQSLGSSSSLCAALGDLDNDGDLDAWVANYSSQANKVWMNDGSGTFADSGQSLGSSSSWGMALGDVDRDGDLDAWVANSGQANKVWTNIGGSAHLDVTATAPGNINNSTEDDVMQVDFIHNGIAADRDLEMNFWNVALFRDDCSTPLTSAEANALIDTLYVRLDDGNGTFEGTETAVATVASLSLSSGVQQISFTNGDTNVQLDQDVTPNRTYWLSLLMTGDASSQSPNAFCLNIDPDADALVEGKTPDFSVSQQDTGPTNTGGINATPTAVSLVSFSATPQRNAIRLDWETASELDNLGFNVYRSESAEGERVQLNATLIPSQNPGSPVGGVYTWLDQAVTPGVTYYYWLEDVDVTGRATLHGPESAMVKPKARPVRPVIQPVAPEQDKQ